ncbi:MAG TPA: cbb3-type cytochrome c oxidase subunit I [Ilumatobacter sp.]|nr:cbb3-type cytochrome c oxidase subunit I [Ilumatobacter sp.]
MTTETVLDPSHAAAEPTHDAPSASADGAASGSISAFFIGAADWVTSPDHKKIGRLYAGFGLLVLAAAAVVATLLGLERADDGTALLEAGALLQVFQVYRVGLIVGGLVPLALGLALAVAPLQVGARQAAFPRVALVGFYFWLAGLTFTIVALGRNGGIGGGDATGVDLFLAGLGLAALGLAATATSVATTVLTARAPGMTMRRVPLFAWSALIGSLGLLLVLPVVFGTVIYLFVDHRLGASQNFRGAPGIGAWLGWLLTVPAAIAFAVPAVGVAAELFPVTFRARQQLRGVAFAGISLVGVAALAAMTQQTAIEVSLSTDQTFGEFVDGAVPFLLFAGLPLLGLLIVFALGGLTAQTGIGTAGKPNLSPAFLFAFIGAGLVMLGLVANFLQGITNLELLGTAFEEGATLLVAYGALLALLGGLVFWAPKLWGVVVPPLHVVPLALLGAAGAALAGGSAIVGGVLDQPGGVPTDDAAVARLLSLDFSDAGSLLAVLGLIGHAAIALTVVAFAALLLKVRTSGVTDEPNPGKGHTIEWGTASPAPADNYPHVPTVASAEPAFDLSYEGTL